MDCSKPSRRLAGTQFLETRVSSQIKAGERSGGSGPYPSLLTAFIVSCRWDEFRSSRLRSRGDLLDR